MARRLPGGRTEAVHHRKGITLLSPNLQSCELVFDKTTSSLAASIMTLPLLRALWVTLKRHGRFQPRQACHWIEGGKPHVGISP